jgi:membrane associated rhomboid family serine protease
MADTPGLVKRSTGTLVTTVKRGAVPIVGSLAAIWTVSVANWVLFGSTLAAYGVRPLTIDGLWGILFAPFLHGSLAHLTANTVGFLMLAPLTMLRKRMDFYVVSVAGALSGGLLSWVFGGLGTTHIGVSGVLYAYLGFLMARGFFERSWGAIALSAFMFWAFSGLLWSVFPILAGVGISWQAHLGGFIGGVLVARLLGNRLRADQKRIG